MGKLYSDNNSNNNTKRAASPEDKPESMFCAAHITSVMIHEGFRSGYKRERAHLEKEQHSSGLLFCPKNLIKCDAED